MSCQVWLSGLLRGLVRAVFRAKIVVLVSRVDKVVLQTGQIGSLAGQKCYLYGRYEVFRAVGTHLQPTQGKSRQVEKAGKWQAI